jgi:anti-sigma regulatory factor (Ser/Thr protein kinase)
MMGPLVDRTFVGADITAVRHEVARHVVAAGLTGTRQDGFVLAVNELVTNVVLHAGGVGRIRLARTATELRCTVTDSGPGIPDRHLGAGSAPAVFAVGGRGIWLAHQLCDAVEVSTGPDGSRIDLRAVLDAQVGAGMMADPAAVGAEMGTNRREDVRRPLEG